MKIKALTALALVTTTFFFTLPSYANENFNNLKQSVLNAWNSSSASHTCTLDDVLIMPSDSDLALRITTTCKGTNWLGKKRTYKDISNPMLKDVTRLVNCNGYIRYDRCK